MISYRLSFRPFWIKILIPLFPHFSMYTNHFYRQIIYSSPSTVNRTIQWTIPKGIHTSLYLISLFITKNYVEIILSPMDRSVYRKPNSWTTVKLVRIFCIILLQSSPIEIKKRKIRVLNSARKRAKSVNHTPHRRTD